MSKKGNVVILGAGPAGMACAMELHNQKKKFILIEKSDSVGGLAKTYKFGKFRTDNGPHRFYSKNKFLYDFIGKLLKKDWIRVKRITRQYIDGKFYDYPVNAVQALKNIGLRKAIRIVVDYLISIIVYRIFRKKIKNFEDYIVSNFGWTLGNFNMLNYSEKQWGMKCNQLDADWAEQRIKGLNFREALINGLKNSFSLSNSTGPKTLVDEFYYPALGAGQVYQNIFKIIKKENSVLLSTFPIRIKHKYKKIKSVVLNTNKIISTDNLVTSIPIDEFVNLLDPPAPIKVQRSLSNLKYRSQVYLFITINKNFITHDQWIYFPDSSIPLFRISEMKNFSNKMSPKGKTSLFVEYFCWEGDAIWKMTKRQIYEMTIGWLEKLNFVRRKDVLDYYHIKSTKTYPVYDLGYKRNLKVVTTYLDKFNNLIYIGRPGRFKYTNQDHSLEMGILAARSIIEKRRINIEDVGSEREYFEKGYAKN